MVEHIKLGKRGPAPRGEYEGKSKVVSTRMTPETRTGLEAAALKSGRSLSQEIELRLARTFREDGQANEAFGSIRNRRLFQVVALAMTNAWSPDDPSEDWLDNPVAFAVAVEMANNIFKAIKPKGPSTPKDEMLSLIARGQAISGAGRLVRAIQQSDPALPIDRGTREEQFLAVLKTEIGDVIARAEVVEGDAEDFRTAAKKLEAKPKGKRNGKR